MDIYETKKKIAIENASFLQELNIGLKGKKVLDIGFGLGYNSDIMRKLGAEVYGVEPDKEAFDFAISQQFVDSRRVFNSTLQDMPQELFGTFDLATIFLYSISFSERENVIQLLAKSIKPIGTTIIGLHDDIYINGDSYMEPVSNLVRKNFNSVSCKKANYLNIGNRMFIVGKEPKTLQKKDIEVDDGWDR